MISEARPDGDVAILVSGGIDSAVLCVDLLRSFARVHPLYVRCGLRWEDVELAHLKRFLAAVPRAGLRPLALLSEPVADVYGNHWSTGAADVPGEDTSDEAVYLPGRNLLLTAKAGIWCRLRDIDALALGCLSANPFADSTPDFFRAVEAVVNQAAGGQLRILRPYERLDKPEVLRRGADLPLHLTFSCLNPVSGLHCGACNKCAERRGGFRELGLPDRTVYARLGTAVSSAGPTPTN